MAEMESKDRSPAMMGLDAVAHHQRSGVDVWVFGYGSLVWKAGFTYETKTVGCIKGYRRRFWQASTDHRGVPERPGRVATLVPTHIDDDGTEAVTWGVAYKLHGETVTDVMEYLDYREKGGYTVISVDVFRDAYDLEPMLSQVLVYVGTEDNPNYLGPAPVEHIAEQIATCAGPSGPNDEYLFNLCEAMRAMVPHIHDRHLIQLETLVREYHRRTNEARGGKHKLVETCLVTTELTYMSTHVQHHASHHHPMLPLPHHQHQHRVRSPAQQSVSSS